MGAVLVSSVQHCWPYSRQPLLSLSCMMTLRWSLLPLPVPMRLLRPYLPRFMSSKASQMCGIMCIMCHHLTTSTPLIRQPSKASAFLLPHQIQPSLVQYGTSSPQVLQRPAPLLKLRHPPLFPLPPHPVPLSSSTTQTSWRLPNPQSSHLQLLLIQLSTIYFLQLRCCLQTCP